MNGLSDSLTIGLVLALVFGALFFYIYTRMGQVEKRVGLTENILLDLKMATENTLMAMASGPPDMEERHQVQAISEPSPLEQEEVEQIPDEEFYKSVLQQVPSNGGHEEESVRPMDVNYEAMTLKELKALAKQKNMSIPTTAHKKDVIEALKRNSSQSSVLEPAPGSLGGMQGVEEDGFPVELGSAENRNALQE